VSIRVIRGQEDLSRLKVKLIFSGYARRLLIYRRRPQRGLCCLLRSFLGLTHPGFMLSPPLAAETWRT
jgi:hypothetical protein